MVINLLYSPRTENTSFINNGVIFKGGSKNNMTTDKKNADLMSLFEADIENEDNEKLEANRSDANVQHDLEQEKMLAEVRGLFEEGTLTYGEFVDDDGAIRPAIYSQTSKGTPLNKLMEMCEADLPYVDENTKQDFENYIEEFGITEVDYDPLAERNKKIDDLV